MNRERRRSRQIDRKRELVYYRNFGPHQDSDVCSMYMCGMIQCQKESIMLQRIKSSKPKTQQAPCTSTIPSTPIVLQNLCQEHATRILNVLLDLHQESGRFPSIYESVVVSQGQVHHLEFVSHNSAIPHIGIWCTHRSNFDFAVNWNSTIENSMQTQHCGLWWIDDWGGHE